MSDAPIYVNQLRKLLNEVNYCNVNVHCKFEDGTEGDVPCALEALCEDCRAKLVNLFDWADLEESTAETV